MLQTEKFCLLFNNTLLQLIRGNTSNDTTISSLSQSQALNNCQNLENKLEIDNQVFSLLLLFDLRLCEVEKLNKIKLYRRLSGPLKKKNLFAKKKNFNNLHNKSFYILRMLTLI